MTQTTIIPESPERLPFNTNRIEKEIQDAAKDAGVILPEQLLNDLTEIVVCECIELRERVANRIIGHLVNRGGGCTEDQLERLAYIVEYHFEDSTGSIEVVEPPAAPKVQPVALKRIK